MNSSQIYCTNCNAPVSAEAINIKAMVGKCDNCDHVFNIAPPAGALPFDDVAIDALYGSGIPPRPKNITKEAGPAGELYLKKRWFTPTLFFLLFFCIAWDGFLVFWYSTAFTQANTPWIMIVFPIGHLAVGVGLTYRVICGFLNTTHIFADQLTVIVTHRPLPWIGNKEMNAKDIRRLMLQRKESYNRHGGPNESVDVMADVNGEEAKLISGLEPSEARFIAYELSKQLKVDLV